MDSSKQIKHGAFLSYLSIFISTVITIIYTPLMLRYLGQEEYGLKSLASSVVCYLELLNLGIGSAMVRYITRYKVLGDTKMVNAAMTLFLSIFFCIAFATMAIGLILIFNIKGLFVESLSSENLYKLQILMFLMTCNIALGMISSVFYAYLMAHERFILMKVQGIINSILNPLVLLPLLLFGYKAIGITIAGTIINIVNSAFIIYYCFRYLGAKICFHRFEKSILKEILTFSFFILLATIVDKIYWGTDQFILGSVSGPIAVAVYSVGASFTTYFMSFSTAITGLFLPRLTEMNERQASNEEFTELFIRVGRLQFFILCFILGAFVVLGKQFIILWAGADYQNAYYIALVILVPFIVPLIQNLGLQLLYAKNKHKFRSLLLFVIAIANVIISIPAAKLYGGLGCAAITGISFIIGQIIILNWYYHKKIGISISLFWKNICKISIPYFVVLLISLGVIRIIGCDNWLNFVIGGIAYACLYIAIIPIAAMNHYEKSLFISYIPFLRHRKKLA